jgi:hypothetical protein
MDLSSLATLGKVAGVGGIAIGAVVLLVRSLISGASSVPAAQRASLLRLVAFCAFGIGALGIIAWLISGLQGGNVTASGGGIAAGRDITGNVSTATPPGGAPPTNPAVKPP